MFFLRGSIPTYIVKGLVAEICRTGTKAGTKTQKVSTALNRRLVNHRQSLGKKGGKSTKETNVYERSSETLG
jgi:hypothetical protein